VGTGGRRMSPPDDSGGIYSFDERVRDLGRDGDDLDLDELNDSLATAAAYDRILGGLPVELRLVLARCLGTRAHDTLLELVLEAGLDTAAEPTETLAFEATERYRWLLERVGSTGLTLTAAGYLPPVVVEAAYTALGMQDEWFGKGNREDMTIPVLTLRTTAVKLGLLRKSRGTLLLTKAGSAAATDPVVLWRHVVGRLPLEPEDSVVRLVSVIRLLGLAAGRDVSARLFRELVASTLTALGWRSAGGPVMADTTYALDGVTDDVLTHLGVFDRDSRGRRHGSPSPQGRVVARAVLQGLAAHG
jgi:hypothetical protein